MTDPTTRDRGVAVSGVGAVSGWGWGAGLLWDGLARGTTRIGSFARFPHEDYPTHIACEVADDHPSQVDDRRLPFADRFAVWAALEALRHAALPDDLSKRRVGVYFGSSTGGMFECEEWYAARGGRPLRRLGARAIAHQQVASPSEAVARRVRAVGPVETVSSACASATLSIENALRDLRGGIVDVAIAGGADSLCRVTYAGFNALQAVAGEPSQPFRAARQGLSLGEGGAAMILERVDDAARRGVKPLALLLGAGSSGDGHHMTAPHPEGAGAVLALRRALTDAGVDRDAVDFVNAHATGTELNDAAEYAALRAVFDTRVGTLPIVCPKASVGHLLGSAGAIEAVLTAQIIERRTLPPNAGAGPVDPATPLSVERTHPVVDRPVRVGVTLNLGFGGCNGALVFARASAA